MTTTDSLLLHLCRYPDDIPARLVYADALEDHGDEERGELIRVQCELSKPSVCEWMTREKDCKVWNAGVQPYRTIVWCPSCHRQADLCQRERELLSAHRYSWLPSILMAIESEVAADACQWHNGFPDQITTTCAAWLAHGTQIVAAMPVVHITLTDAVIHPSGGNSTYYVGGLGRFPREFWSSLENLPTRRAAIDALSTAALTCARREALLDIPCDHCSGTGKMTDWSGLWQDCPRCVGWRVAE